MNQKPINRCQRRDVRRSSRRGERQWSVVSKKLSAISCQLEPKNTNRLTSAPGRGRPSSARRGQNAIVPGRRKQITDGKGQPKTKSRSIDISISFARINKGAMRAGPACRASAQTRARAPRGSQYPKPDAGVSLFGATGRSPLRSPRPNRLTVISVQDQAVGRPVEDC